MNKFFVHIACIVALLLCAIGVLAMPVTAQSAPNTTATETPDRPRGDLVDQDVTLVSSGYNDTAENAYLELHSDRYKTVTISDGGALADGGGEIPSRTVVLEENTTTRVVVPATKTNGKVAVVISTDETLYGHIISEPDYLVGNPFSYQDAQLTAASAAGTVALISIIMVARYIAGDTSEPERLA
jgi:hypothetical protein